MPKTVYLVIFLILLLVVVVIIQFSTKPKSQPPQESPKVSVESFRIISSDVPEEFIGITEPIKITFSKPVNLNYFRYEIRPQTEVRVYTDPNQTVVTFDPKDAWVFDSDYSLRIPKESQATDGRALDQEYIYKFKTHPYSGI